MITKNEPHVKPILARDDQEGRLLDEELEQNQRQKDARN